jgi:hypothetical protein
MNAAAQTIVIKGITREGRKFRPSDWAQRLTTAVASPGPGKRIRFHPKVHMARIEGVDCVLIDKTLADEEPAVYKFLLQFAEFNNLQTDER